MGRVAIVGGAAEGELAEDRGDKEGEGEEGGGRHLGAVLGEQLIVELAYPLTLISGWFLHLQGENVVSFESLSNNMKDNFMTGKAAYLNL